LAYVPAGAGDSGCFGPAPDDGGGDGEPAAGEELRLLLLNGGKLPPLRGEADAMAAEIQSS
jgi:hypothetical protein